MQKKSGEIVCIVSGIFSAHFYSLSRPSYSVDLRCLLKIGPVDVISFDGPMMYI